jgi:delta-aminolevulinic acid dehydratase/porphobilinogen synthase
MFFYIRYGYKKVVENLEPLVKKGLKSILVFGILSNDKSKDEVSLLQIFLLN